MRTVGLGRLWLLDNLDHRILAIAIPALGSLLIQPMYVLTDTAVVGHLGTVPLGGLALATTVLTTTVWVFNFLSYGTTVRVAVRRGRGDVAGAAGDALQGLWLASAIGLVVGGFLAVGAGWLIDLIGDDPAVVEQGTLYLRISAVGVPFHFITLASIGYLYGIPDTTRPFVVAALANVANLAIELLLVFGFDWGISGSAWGTVVAEMLSAVAMLVIVVPRLRRDGLHRLDVVPRVMWEVIKVGAHLVQRTAFLLAALALATTAASHVGRAELAAHQIVAQLFLFLAIGVDMFKVAGQSLVGHSLGAQHRSEARSVVDHLLWWGLRAGLLLTLVVIAVGPLLARIFSSDPEVLDAVWIALVVLALMQLPGAVTFVLDGALMGANDFRNLRWQTTVAFAVAAPFFIAVRLRPSLGLATVWTGLLAWMIVRALWNHLRARGTAWMASADAV